MVSPDASPGSHNADEPQTIYDKGFFDEIRPGVVRSAQAVVPVVMEQLRPRKVLDIGCGEGHWLAAFKAAGCRVHGVDGDYVPTENRVLGTPEYTAWDLRTPLPNSVRSWGADLVLCLEVAEHLPAERAQTFVEDLCASGRQVLFSAAVPRQGGYGHLNEQPRAYWVHLFDQLGFRCDDEIRTMIAAREDVAWWYRQNVVLAKPTVMP